MLSATLTDHRAGINRPTLLYFSHRTKKNEVLPHAIGTFANRTKPTCKLPQKQYVLKVAKLVNFKNVKHEKESIHPHPDCQHTQGV